MCTYAQVRNSSAPCAGRHVRVPLSYCSISCEVTRADSPEESIEMVGRLQYGLVWEGKICLAGRPASQLDNDCQCTDFGQKNRSKGIEVDSRRCSAHAL